MNERTTEEDLNSVLNNPFCFNEKKILSIKKILLNSNFKEMNLNFLVDLDNKFYTSRNNKRTIYKNIIKKMGFNLIKRKRAYIRKRLRKTYNTFSDIPDYVFKTFWIIQINQNENRQ